MRIDLKKYLFIGYHSLRDSFFERAQELGLVHFIDKEQKPQELPETIQATLSAIKVLRGLPTMKQEEPTDSSVAGSVKQRVLGLKHEIEKLSEEERILNLEIARIEIFGNFSLEDIAYIKKEGGRSLQFFCAKKRVAEEETLPEELIYIDSDHGLNYFVAVNAEPKQYDKMIEMRIEQPVGALRKKLISVRETIHAREQQLKTYAKYNDFLHHVLVSEMNVYNLTTAESFAENELEGGLFAVQGWVPVDKVDELNALVRRMSVHYEEIAVEEEDRIPTCLENSGASRIGEDLVHIYDTPASDDKDPSLWVFLFFSFFFAFIVGDGGYGLIFLATALYLRYKFKETKGMGRRILNLALVLSLSCIAWGVLTTSFFGVSFGPDSPMQKGSLINWLVKKKTAYHQQHWDKTYRSWSKQYPEIAKMHDPDRILHTAVKEKGGKISYDLFESFSNNILLELALVVGMLHIALSFFRYLGRNWSGVGWILFIVGGYLYFPYYLETPSMLHYVFGFHEEVIGPEGFNLLLGGLGLALFLGILQHKLAGLLEMMTVIQIFGDILSYLRLYALGLASGIVSATVNELASSVFVFAGILILIFGHLVNIILSIMGGVIHGLRLNFIEWYHYSFEGGGKMYNPLRKLSTE